MIAPINLSFFRFGLSLVVVLGIALRVPDRTLAETPNIVFILADDVGVEPLACYGGSSFMTPNLDQLADSGIRFLHCYSMPVCHPTRVCLLTGRYPRKIGQPGWGSFPEKFETATLAQRLKRAGYTTAVAGKWQLALLRDDPQHPQRLGFDEHCLFGWHEGARYHDPLIWQNGVRREDTSGKFGPDLYVEYLIDFMRRSRERPFFAFYSMALCHDVTDDLKQPVPYVPGKDRYLSYREMVHLMDDYVGRIVRGVNELGISEKTLIVFTGDNGTARRSIIQAAPSKDEPSRWIYRREPVFCEMNGHPVAGGKGRLDDTGTRVPLLAVWPGTIQPNQEVDDLVDFSDFLPTFSELAGEPVEQDATLDGVSLVARLKGTGSHARKWAYSEAKNRFWVRTQRYKLTNDGRFFDVHNDPEETQSISAKTLAEPGLRVRMQLQEVIDRINEQVQRQSAL